MEVTGGDGEAAGAGADTGAGAAVVAGAELGAVTSDMDWYSGFSLSLSSSSFLSGSCCPAGVGLGPSGPSSIFSTGCSTWRVSTGSVGPAGEGGVTAPARARSARSARSFSTCSSTICWYFSSSTATTQCFLISTWNSSELSWNFLFLPSYFSSMVVSSASSFFWCMVRLWTCLRSTCILAVVTTLRTSGTIVSPKISLMSLWFLM